MSTTYLVGSLAAVSALACWYSAAKGVQIIYRPTKVGTLVLLVALAASMGAADSLHGWALLVGLSCGLVGDVLLLRKDNRAFLAGLSAFLLGHLCYVVVFAVSWLHPVNALLAAVLVSPFAVLSLTRVRSGAGQRSGSVMAYATLGYGSILSVMAIAAGATGQPLTLAGGVLFVVSDTVLALDRFDAPRPYAGVVVIMTYQLAQAFIVLGSLS
ncbi:lysoplasmalogenase [Austwickia chelonae]|uniref:lysoplasmalogenase n=1 Tax=Austwickia chelonae TaxID=100225 RepID=UPI0013C30EAC|nr:lysoplasmalogenase [Austwickia chelonae]